MSNDKAHHVRGVSNSGEQLSQNEIEQTQVHYEDGLIPDDREPHRLVGHELAPAYSEPRGPDENPPPYRLQDDGLIPVHTEQSGADDDGPIPVDMEQRRPDDDGLILDDRHLSTYEMPSSDETARRLKKQEEERKKKEKRARKMPSVETVISWARDKIKRKPSRRESEEENSYLGKVLDDLAQIYDRKEVTGAGGRTIVKYMSKQERRKEMFREVGDTFVAKVNDSEVIKNMVRLAHARKATRINIRKGPMEFRLQVRNHAFRLGIMDVRGVKPPTDKEWEALYREDVDVARAAGKTPPSQVPDVDSIKKFYAMGLENRERFWDMMQQNYPGAVSFKLTKDIDLGGTPAYQMAVKSPRHKNPKTALFLSGTSRNMHRPTFVILPTNSVHKHSQHNLLTKRRAISHH